MKKWIFFLPVFFLASCSSIETMKISVQKPAQMTLPLDIRNITLVNNAVVQPENVGHIVSTGSDERNVVVSSDSLDIILIQAFAQFMTEENFFDQVQVYDKPLRSDNSFLSEQLLEPTITKAIAQQTGADAVISLDRFTATSIYNYRTYQSSFPNNILEVKMQAKFRIYKPDGKLMNYPILFEDTLYWDNSKPAVTIPTQREALRQSALHVADKMVSMFIPFWQDQHRWIYINNNKQMKQAAADAKENKWKEAAFIWGELWNTEKNPVNQAKIASNIAIANEMLDDVENALNWAKISYDLFYPERKKESRKEDFFRIEALKEELEQRLIDINKLSKQKGISDQPDEEED